MKVVLVIVRQRSRGWNHVDAVPRAHLHASNNLARALSSVSSLAQVPLRDDHTGPYNVTILEGGEGFTRKLEPGTASLEANGAWSMSGWVNAKRLQPGGAVLLAVGGRRPRASPAR